MAWEATPLAGRRVELGALFGRFQRARDGRGGVALVTGESGIGKSRLLDGIAHLAAEAGALVLRGEASNADGMPPYLPFLEALGPISEKLRRLYFSCRRAPWLHAGHDPAGDRGAPGRRADRSRAAGRAGSTQALRSGGRVSGRNLRQATGGAHPG